MVGYAGDFIADGLAALSVPAQAVQARPPVRQGVYLRLQGVVLHGKLLRRLYAVAVEIEELALVAVEPDHLLPRGKGRPRMRTALLDASEEV